MIPYVFAAPLTALFTGSLVYCVIAIVGAYKYTKSGAPLLRTFPAISVLRPMAGAEDNTQANLRSLFAQDYPEFEVLISVHDPNDPALTVARQVMAEFPNIPARLVVVGPSPAPNAKVWSLQALLREARYDHFVMSDSDIGLDRGCVKTVVSELSQSGVALVTCPYRALGGPRFWPRVESLGLNTDFLAGMLTQRLLNGMDFAIGCTIATRREELAAIGGFEHLRRYLAEDFMMGNLMHGLGRKVVLSRSVIEHYIGNDPFLKNWKHRLRWARSTRRSRPAGYVGEIFTKPFAISLLLCAVMPRLWPAALIALLFRGTVACATGVILRDRTLARYWWLLPVEDLASFVTWILGFFGKTIDWRGRKLVIARDGSFEM